MRLVEGGFLRSVALCAAPLDPLHYMMLLGSKYDPNMNREPRVHLKKAHINTTAQIVAKEFQIGN
jgi:hypothetical protein